MAAGVEPAWAQLRLAPGVSFQPSLDASVTHDSNVWLATDRPVADPALREPQRGEESDVFYTVHLQLAMAANVEHLRSMVDVWAGMERYDEFDARDTEEIGVRGQVGFGGRKSLDVRMYGRYAEVERYDYGPVGYDLNADGVGVLQPDPMLYERSSVQQRKLTDIQLHLGRDLTDKTTLDLRANVLNTRYSRDRADLEVYFRDVDDTWRLNDITRYHLEGEAGWRATDKTTLFVNLGGELEESDGFDDDASSISLRLGALSATSPKLQFRAGAGISHYRYDSFPTDPRLGEPGYYPDRDRGPAETSKSTRPSFELGVNWLPADRWVFQASAYSGFQSAVQYAGTGTFFYGAQVGANYQMLQTLRLSLTASARQTDYLETVQVANETSANLRRFEEDKYARLYAVAGRLTYRPVGRRVSGYAEARHAIADSNDPDAEYDATQFTLGLNLQY